MSDEIMRYMSQQVSSFNYFQESTRISSLGPAFAHTLSLELCQ